MTTSIIIVAVIAIIAFLFFFSRKKNGSEHQENDAGRFAKLLVSEIRLYETYKFERGLKINNLYESLSIEIKEARKKYKKRFPNPESEAYFDEALLDVLANGDKSLLGLIPVSESH